MHVRDSTFYCCKRDLQEAKEVRTVINKEAIVQKNLASKTKLHIFAEVNGLGKPTFDLTFVNPNDPEWLYHVAMVNLDNLTSRGSGRTKRKAEERGERGRKRGVKGHGGNSRGCTSWQIR